eukprot:501668-Hanusia_phi.AAC.3
MAERRISRSSREIITALGQKILPNGVKDLSYCSFFDYYVCRARDFLVKKLKSAESDFNQLRRVCLNQHVHLRSDDAAEEENFQSNEAVALQEFCIQGEEGASIQTWRHGGNRITREKVVVLTPVHRNNARSKAD